MIISLASSAHRAHSPTKTQPSQINWENCLYAKPKSCDHFTIQSRTKTFMFASSLFLAVDSIHICLPTHNPASENNDDNNN